jgi:hypothetical protein
MDALPNDNIDIEPSICYIAISASFDRSRHFNYLPYHLKYILSRLHISDYFPYNMESCILYNTQHQLINIPPLMRILVAPQYGNRWTPWSYMHPEYKSSALYYYPYDYCIDYFDDDEELEANHARCSVYYIAGKTYRESIYMLKYAVRICSI